METLASLYFTTILTFWKSPWPHELSSPIIQRQSAYCIYSGEIYHGRGDSIIKEIVSRALDNPFISHKIAE